MSLDVKFYFCLVRAPGVSSRTKKLWMAGFSRGYPVNASETGDLNLGCESIPRCQTLPTCISFIDDLLNLT